MNKNFSQTNHSVINYAENVFLGNTVLMDEIRERAKNSDLPPIHVGAFDALHLEVLVRMSGAKKVVEIGTLAGLSGLALLKGAGKDSKLFTFEFDEKHAEVARNTFKLNGVDSQVELYVGAAAEQLGHINSAGPFDLVFIDADKVNYPVYLTWAEKNLRSGGVVIADNTFAWGHIADQSFNDLETENAVKALREFNRRCADVNGPFRSTILPTGEGLTIAVKK